MVGFAIIVEVILKMKFGLFFVLIVILIYVAVVQEYKTLKIEIIFEKNNLIMFI